MKKLALFVFLALPFITQAQKNISMADAILKGRGALAPANLRQIQWIPNSNEFTHHAGSKIVRVNAASLATDTLEVLNPLNEGLKKNGASPLIGLPAYAWIDRDQFWFNTGKEIYTYHLANGLNRRNWYPENAENIDIHTKTFKAAYTLNDQLMVSIGGKDLGVAKSEKPGIVYGKSVHRDEFGISKGTFWSPSGRYLAFYRMDESMVTEYPIYVLDSMPAQARMVRYPFAGAKSHQVTVGIYDSQEGRTLYLNTGEPAEQYLTNVAWSPDDKFVLIAVVNREQNHIWLKQFDAATGAFVKTILEEKSEQWAEPEHPAEFVPGKTDQFIWQSERDGYNHLYLYDLSGKLLRQLSKGAAPVVNFYGFSADGQQAFYQVADDDGLNRFVHSVTLKNGASTRLNEEPGTHNALFNTQGNWSVDVFANLEKPRVVYVQPVAKPSERQIVFSAKNPLEDYRLGITRLSQLTSKGGVTLNARMILPPDFDAAKKYPVLVYVYNGPHVQLITNSWLSAAELWMHHMAQEGYIIFTLDGRGSGNRGYAFESAIHRRLGDAEIEDQMTGIQYLKSQTYVDASRIGVFGWSYGGFMATSLMTRPEAQGAFKCGVAGGPVLDWRMYEIMYTERYMDTPQENPEGYEKNSLFKYIDNLNGKLLMIHGSSDDVVLWQHSLRYIRECVRKGKQIDYFVYPEHAHNVLGKDRVHLFEKIEAFVKGEL
jgi:dipeptidyl-peptidase 4